MITLAATKLCSYTGHAFEQNVNFGTVCRFTNWHNLINYGGGGNVKQTLILASEIFSKPP